MSIIAHRVVVGPWKIKSFHVTALELEDTEKSVVGDNYRFVGDAENNDFYEVMSTCMIQPKQEVAWD